MSHSAPLGMGSAPWGGCRCRKTRWR